MDEHGCKGTREKEKTIRSEVFRVPVFHSKVRCKNLLRLASIRVCMSRPLCRYMFMSNTPAAKGLPERNFG
jgi:hypothetical protein